MLFVCDVSLQKKHLMINGLSSDDEGETVGGLKQIVCELRIYDLCEGKLG